MMQLSNPKVPGRDSFEEKRMQTQSFVATNFALADMNNLLEEEDNDFF